jgi:hypothetical protein
VRHKFKQIVSAGGHHLYGEFDIFNTLKGHGLIIGADLSWFRGGLFGGYFVLSGQGFCRYNNGVIYRGNLMDDEPHDIHGELFFIQGDYCTGNFINGERFGHGTYNWTNSYDVYTGNFENGFLQGYGTMKHKNGVIYSGEWKESIQNGFGQVIQMDGTVYAGNRIKNKTNGAFLISNNDTDSCCSLTFENDFKHGLSTTTQNNGYVMRYEHFQNGKLHGNSLIVDKTTGEINSTEYSEGLKHGDEKHTVSGKCTKLLHWSQGKLMFTEIVSGGWLDTLSVFIDNMLDVN